MLVPLTAPREGISILGNEGLSGVPCVFTERCGGAGT